MSTFVFALIAACLLWPMKKLSADTVRLADGGHKEGRVWGVAQEVLVLSTQPIPGLPPVEIRIPQMRIRGITFSPDEQRDHFLQNATPRQLPEMAELWGRFAPLLSLDGSPSARIGLRYGLLLLAVDHAERRSDPLVIFERIASTAPLKADQEAARQGVLRTLLQRREMERAESEATSIIKSTCGVALLAEARLSLGMLGKTKLEAFLEAHPKWHADEFARPLRDRLYETALDNLLGSVLLPGAPAELAVRGLYCALQMLASAGERQRAAILAGDLIAFYPESPEAMFAREWLQANPAQPGSKPN